MQDDPAYGVQNHEIPGYMEKAQSRMSVLHLLMQLGWQYLTPEATDRLRGERPDNTILEPVLVEHIRSHSRFTFKGNTHPFTENAIHSAVQALKGFRATGTVHQAEQAYDLLCLGTSVPQTIEGDTKSFSINYIDWRNPANNTYHCTTEFKVERIGFQKQHISDIVLFVNGIPLVVMESKCTPNTKTREKPVDWAIRRLIDHQAKDGIPQLFLFSQLLLALAPENARYGTTGTQPQFWSVWKERGIDGALKRVMNTKIEEQALIRLISMTIGDAGPAHFDLVPPHRKITDLDRTLYSLCRPERLLEITYKFILFDGGAKKIARHHQYFTVQDIIKRVLTIDGKQPRPGGVVWHTQGSGKSLTMVMLAKSLALHSSIHHPKIILVTDRIDLDDQIYGTFRACGLAPEQATTGKHLVALLNHQRTHVVTTLIHKFAAAMTHRDLKKTDRNTFVLADEGHRSQYSRQHARMRLTLNGACFIAFTGTPLAKSARKNTFARFGNLFRPSYTIGRAVADKAVVPLLYEARYVPQRFDHKSVDIWFEQGTTGLSIEQKVDLKRRFSTEHQLNIALQKVRMIAWDVSMHFSTTYQDTGLKGQLVAPDKQTALKYKTFLDHFDLVTSEVLISAPTAREGEDMSCGPCTGEKVFWRKMMERYGTEKNYNKQLINAFKRSDHPEIIIVVDKLLTGFNAPHNTVLYLARKLREHTLLQAIARVNRLHPGKEYGLILDYRGVTQELDKAIDFYDQLTEFDSADIEKTVTYVREQTLRLPKIHAQLWNLFDVVKQTTDPEIYETHLRDDGLRSYFYERFSLFARTLALALSSTTFLMETDQKHIHTYKTDLKFFQNLRAAVGRRYQESADISSYEPRIKKVIDTHLGAGEVKQLCSPINLLDAAQRTKVLEDDNLSVGAKVDIIAAATNHVIEQEMSTDPLFYKNFSKLLKKVIETHHSGRLLALEALEKIRDIATKVTTHTDDDIPNEIADHYMARRYYGCVCETLPAYGPTDNTPGVLIAKRIAERLDRHKIRDWRTNPDVINKMRGEIDDILFDVAEEMAMAFSIKDQDTIIDRCIQVAIANED